MGNDVVFWSGGQDSTLVALQLLRAKKFVNLVSLCNNNIGGERQRNLEAIKRKACLAKMEKEFGKNMIHAKEAVFDANFSAATVQLQFFGSLFPLLCQDGDTAHYGVISTDSYWHEHQYVEEVFNAVCKVCHIKVKLNYPLEWYNKKMVVKELKQYGYLDYTIHSGDSL